MKAAMRVGLCCFGVIGLTIAANSSRAQNPNFPGYLGVYVVEGNGGMRITGFIEDTPAEALALDGELNRNDTIVRLGGRSTRTLSELRAARNRIPDGQEAKMILRGRAGTYYVWISRSEAVAASPGAVGSAPSRADMIVPGGKGEGGAEDFRPRRPRESSDEGEFRNKP